MHNRRERILKLSCLVLAAALAFQLARFILVGDPAKGLVIPALPSLPAELDAQSAKSTNAPSAKGTNSPTNQASVKTGTNSSSSIDKSNSVNLVDSKNPVQGTHAAQKTFETNAASTKETSPGQSNSVVEVSANAKQPESGETNTPAKSSANSTNAVSAIVLGGKGTNTNTTNLVAGLKSGTNSTPNASAKTNTLPPGRMAMGMGMGGKPPELPAEIKERVDRITQGEILGQIMRPMPMALLGIAGPNAFLRSPDGQTGMIKEGEKLGNLKLLRIGNNRVLVEEEGEKKELSIFAGLGSESLMPAKEPSANEKKPNEPTLKSP